jgi:arginine exporter protein ArgO
MSADHTTHSDERSATSPRSRVRDYSDRAEIRVIAHTVGGAFLLLGLLGFVPGITTHYGDLGLAGPDSKALLFGFLQVSVLLNVLYLVYGAAGITAARTAVSARNYFLAGGVLFGILWLYGLVVDQEGSSNLLAVNRADNWWHLVLCLGMVALGVLMGRRTSSRSDEMAV